MKARIRNDRRPHRMSLNCIEPISSVLYRLIKVVIRLYHILEGPLEGFASLFAPHNELTGPGDLRDVVLNSRQNTFARHLHEDACHGDGSYRENEVRAHELPECLSVFLVLL